MSSGFSPWIWRRPNPQTSKKLGCAPIPTPFSLARLTVSNMTSGSPPWKPQATFAEVTIFSISASLPMVQAPKLSPMSQLRSITSIGVTPGFQYSLYGRIWEEFAAQGQLDAVAFGVRLAFDRHVEIDRTHDAVAELLLDQFLPGRAVDLHQFVEPVDQRVGRDHRRQRAAVGDLLQQALFVLVEVEQFGGAFGLLRPQLHLPHQGRGQIDRRTAADLGDDRLPSQALGAFCGEDLTGQFVTGHRVLLW